MCTVGKAGNLGNVGSVCNVGKADTVYNASNIGNAGKLNKHYSNIMHDFVNNDNIVIIILLT